MKILEKKVPVGKVRSMSEKQFLSKYMTTNYSDVYDCGTCNNCGSGNCGDCCGSTDD